MWATAATPLLVYLWLHLHTSLAQQSPPKIHIKDVSDLGPQVNPHLSQLSRDGGASVLLNDHVVWLFDDTQVSSDEDELLVFASNTAAYSHAPKANLTLLQNFGIHASAVQSLGQGGHDTATDQRLSGGGWIPFTADESAFNQQAPGKERVAICKC